MFSDWIRHLSALRGRIFTADDSGGAKTLHGCDLRRSRSLNFNSKQVKCLNVTLKAIKMIAIATKDCSMSASTYEWFNFS